MSVVVIRTNTNTVSVTANDNEPSYVDQITTGTVSVNTVTSVVTVTPIAQGAQGPPGPPTGVQSVTGDGVGGTASNVVMTFPTLNDIGAYSNTNPSGFINVAGAPVQSVNGDTGAVVLDANDVGAYSNTNPLAFINIGAVPIKTVTGQGVDNTNVGNVVVSFPTIDQIGAYSNTNPSGFITSAQAPVQSVTGTQVTGTSANPVINLPTINQIGAYSNTNPSAFINVAQAPVQSVNGDTGIVVLNANDVGAYSNTNPNNFINSAQAPVQSVNGDTGAVVLALDDIDDVNVAGVTNGQSLVYNATATEWQAGTITSGGAVDSVNGQTGVVVLNADDVGAYSNTNPNTFVNVAQASAAAPVQSVNGDTGNVIVYNGGNTSDILVKLSGTDYDTAWTSNITVDSISYDITAGIEPSAEGGTAWSADARTLAINKGNGVIQNITQDLNYAPARNTEATSLIRGELVMVDPAQPAQGQTLRLKRYISNGTLPVDLFVGMVSEAIAPNESGFVEWFGQLRGLSLSALEPVGETWVEGDILWPNPAVAGGMTKVEPTAPAHKVTVAAILNITGNNINVLVRPNLRSRIVDLHDVQVTNVSNSQVLTWNGSIWVNADNPADGVQAVTGDGVGGTASNVVLTFPTVNQIGAYSNTNPSAFINIAQAPVQSVNGQTNIVVLTANDVGAYSNTNPNNFINIAQVPIKTVTGDGVDNSNVGNVVISYPSINDIGAYSNTNPDGFVNSAGAASASPVQSVNGQTNVVVLDADDVGAYSNTNPSAFINIAQASSAAPIQTVTGDGVDNSNVGNVVISFPTLDDIGAYSNTNPANYINVAQASAASPVQSVNGQTNVVVLDADDVGAYSNTNPSSFINVAQAPVQSVNGDTGIVVITANSIGAYLNTNPNSFINSAQAPVQSVTGTLVTGTSANPVVNIPTLDQVGAYSNTNPSAFINVAQAPVQSVNGSTGIVVITANSIGAYLNTNPNAFVNTAQATAAAPIKTVTGQGVDNSNVGNVVISFPTVNDIGAYSNTNPSNFINSAGAPVQSVNGLTGTVNISVDNLIDTNITNVQNEQILRYQSNVWVNVDSPPIPFVATPFNVSPADEAVDVIETPTLQGSTYLSLYGLTMAAAQWQVSEVSDFATTVIDSEVAGTSVTFTVSAGVLDEETVYYWRVRYKDSDNNYSQYSTATEFETDVFLVPFIAVANFNSPFVTAYPWSGSGFGTKFSDPATLPTGDGRGVAFSPDGDAIAVAHTNSPFVTAYPWSVSGFGTKFSNPATLPASTGRRVAFSPDNDAIAVAHDNSPFVTAYPWSGSGFGTKFSDPATLPTGNSRGVAFSPDGNAIAVAHFVTPFITAYAWSGSGFGTKFTNPATLPNGSGFQLNVKFSPDGNSIAIAHDLTPFVTAYPWSGSGFGTKFSDPATLPAGFSEGLAFSPNSDVLVVAHGNSPFVTAYLWSGSGFGTKFSNPSGFPAGIDHARAADFSPDGDAIAIGVLNSPRIIVYSWSVAGFGTKFSDPATLPANQVKDVAFTLA